MDYINFLLRKTFRRRLGKNIGTLIAIALGVSLMAGVQITITSFATEALNYFVDALGETDIIVSNLTLPINNYQQVMDKINQSGIDYVAMTARIMQSVTVYNLEAGLIEKDVSLVGFDFNESPVFHDLYDQNETVYSVTRLNRLLNDSYSVLISERLSSLLKTENGSQVLVRLPYQTPQGGIEYINYNFTIRGIVANKGKGKEYNQEALWLNIDKLREIIHFNSTQCTIIYIALSADHHKNPVPNSKAYEIERKLKKVLESTGLFIYAFRASVLDTSKQILNKILLSFNLFGSLIMLSGLLLIANIQLIQVEDRMQQLGILRAIGSKRKEVIRLFLTESVLLGVLGSIIGLFGGYGISAILVYELEKVFADTALSLSPILTPFAVIYSISLGVILAVAAGVLPAIRASRVDAIEVIRGIKKLPRKRLGLKGLILGIAVVLSSISGFITQTFVDTSYFSYEAWDSWIEQLIFTILGSLIITGLSLIAGYYISKKFMGNFLGIGLTSFTIYVLIDRIPQLNKIEDSNRILTFLVVLLSLSIIIIIGVNLRTVSSFVQRILYTTKIKKGVSLVASKYMQAKSMRSILTFGIFALVLSMNIFASIYQDTYKYNTLGQIEFYSGGTDIFVSLDTPVSSSAGINVTESLYSLDPAITDVRGIRSAFGVQSIDQQESKGEEMQIPFFLVDEITPTTFKTGSTYDYDFIISNSLRQFNREYNPAASEDAKRAYSHKIWSLFYNRTKFNEDGYIDNENGYDTVLSASPIFDPGEILNITYSIGPITISKQLIVLAVVEQYPFSLTSGLPRILITSDLVPLFPAFALVPSPNEFLIKTSAEFRSEKNKEIAEKIEGFFNSKDSPLIKKGEYVAADAYSLWDTMLQIIDFQYKSFDYTQYFVSFGLIVGAIGMVIIAIRNVAERRREIGMMRAIGFKRRQIVYTIIVELMILSGLGLFMGMASGFVLGASLSRLYGWRMIVPVVRLVIYTAIMIGIALVASIVPGIQAARVTPAEALRYVG